MNVHRIMLGASRQCRYRLAGIQDLQWVEALAHCVELVTFRVAELNAHIPELLDAYPMFAGNRASMMDAQLQNFTAQFLGFLQLTLVVCVIQDSRVQITVAGMKHVGHRQFVFGRQFADTGQHSGQ